MESYKPKIKKIIKEIIEIETNEPLEKVETPKKRKRSESSSPQTSSKKVKTSKKMYFSKELQDVIGLERGTVKEVYVLLWEYIRQHKLQSKGNSAIINTNDKLEKVRRCIRTLAFQE